MESLGEEAVPWANGPFGTDHHLQRDKSSPSFGESYSSDCRRDTDCDILCDSSTDQEDTVLLEESLPSMESGCFNHGESAVGPENGIDFDGHTCCPEDYSDLPETIMTQDKANGSKAKREGLLYEGSPLTKDESDLLIVSFAIRWGIQDDCVDDLLGLIDCHLPHAVMGSRNQLFKNFSSPEYHNILYTCPDCFQVLQDKCGTFHCELCCQQLHRETLQEDGHFFLQLSISLQLKEVVESEYLFPFLRNECEERDVISGKVYRLLKESGVVGVKDVTLQWNTDVVPLFSSSKWKVWPIQACINELPYALRRQNMILCGLYFGSCKPRINSFLRPFVKELEQLHLHGVDCNIPISNIVTNVKVHTIVASVSCEIRLMLQGMKTEGCYGGCPFCLCSAMKINEKNGAVYLYMGGVGPPRTLRDHVHALQSLHNEETSNLAMSSAGNGIECPSVLLMLPVFDMTSSFVPDCRSVVQGVVNQFLKHWTDSRYDHCEWHLSKAKCATLCQRLQAFSLPYEIERPPTTIDELLLMKASQCLHFLLYCSIVCLKGILPSKFLNHWFLLVHGISLYICDKFSDDEAAEAGWLLKKFVEDINVLYPNCFNLYTINVHILLHIPQAVDDYGALWASSIDTFENVNSILGQLINQSKFDLNQLCLSFMRFKKVMHIGSEVFSHPKKSLKGNSLFNLLMKNYKGGKQCRDTTLKLLGPPSYYKLSSKEKELVQRVLGDIIDSVVQSFGSIKCWGTLYHTIELPLLQFCPNSIVKTNNGCLLCIYRILVIDVCETNGKKCIAMGLELDILEENIVEYPHLKLKSSLSSLCRLSSRTSYWLPQSFAQKCLCIPYGSALCVIPMFVK